MSFFDGYSLMRNCEQIETLIILALAGEHCGTDNTVVEQHIVSCEDCAKFYSTAIQVNSLPQFAEPADTTNPPITSFFVTRPAVLQTTGRTISKFLIAKTAIFMLIFLLLSTLQLDNRKVVYNFNPNVDITFEGAIALERLDRLGNSITGFDSESPAGYVLPSVVAFDSTLTNVEHAFYAIYARTNNYTDGEADSLFEQSLNDIENDVYLLELDFIF